MASIRRASSSSSSWYLVVTITLVLIVLTICGEIQSTAAAALEDAQSFAVEDRSDGEISEPRTFGRIRMLKNVMLPVMFLLGGVKTLLIFLVAISLKTLFIAASIFIVNLSLGLAKVINFFKHGYGGHHVKEGWSPGLEKNIHIHIHSDPSHQLALEGPPPSLSSVHSSASPTIHSGVWSPYSRSDVIEPIYTSPAQINPYSKFYGLPTALTKQQTLPYSGWQQTSRKLQS
ncbi:uncharacterized protein LOC134214745 isoform X1 [Armigeres subalbatus]|uniref:uncharacterized protein LOC134214745 isoform X1 n=1 Tax=Armigeres subalbatus TaxID=124917 RepID=UPI002ED50483